MYRPPVGIPRREQKRWQGWFISLLAHLLLLLLILLPGGRSDVDLAHRLGAGGAGPAGGGGGGLGGESGGPRLHFVEIAPAAAQAEPTAAITPPPVQPPVPQPEIPKLPPPPLPVTPTAKPPLASPVPQQVAAVNSGAGGNGTGTGRTGETGSGSGSGGGTGSGEGTGRGSGIGPGTGGGAAKNYPPTPRQFFLPPLPAPARLKGFHLTAWFDVDSTGKATLLRFTPSPDGDYNKRLKETLLAVRFRPAVRPDGVAIRDTVDIQFVF